MTPEELQSHLTLHGYFSRIKGEEVQLKSCWMCGNDRWNMELNPSMGVWHCWACRDHGRVDSLLSRILGTQVHLPVRPAVPREKNLRQEDPPFLHKPVGEIPSALRYLAQRGLDPETCSTYGLTVGMEPRHLLEGRILFPLRDFWTGELLGFTGRAYVAGKKPKYVSTLPRGMVTGHRQRWKGIPCVLVEGPLDGIAVHRAGFQAAVLGGTGVPGVEEFAARLPRETPLVILLDGEAHEQASTLRWRIFPVRPDCLLVDLPPGTDPANFRPEVLERLLKVRVTSSREA